MADTPLVNKLKRKLKIPIFSQGMSEIEYLTEVSNQKLEELLEKLNYEDGKESNAKKPTT